MSRHAIVAGAGIGGLTAAVALRRRGWDVTILERAQALEPVGAGLGLGPNALHALDAIGLGDEVRRFSAIQGHGGLRRPGGGWLVRTDLGGLATRFGDPQLVALRARRGRPAGGPPPGGRAAHRRHRHRRGRRGRRSAGLCRHQRGRPGRGPGGGRGRHRLAHPLRTSRSAPVTSARPRSRRRGSTMSSPRLDQSGRGTSRSGSRRLPDTGSTASSPRPTRRSRRDRTGR